MFEIELPGDGRIYLRGRLDAEQAKTVAKPVLDRVETSMTVDFSGLDYISSAGLGVLFALHQRLARSGGGLRFVNLKPVIWELFKIARFHTWIDIEPPPEERPPP